MEDTIKVVSSEWRTVRKDLASIRRTSSKAAIRVASLGHHANTLQSSLGVGTTRKWVRQGGGVASLDAIREKFLDLGASQQQQGATGGAPSV